MDIANCSLEEIIIVAIGIDYIRDLSGDKKWTILNLIKKPALETKFEEKFRNCTSDELTAWFEKMFV